MKGSLTDMYGNAAVGTTHGAVVVPEPFTCHDAVVAVQVVDSMPDMASLNAAAAASTHQLEFKVLLGAKMYRTAVALLSKTSGMRPCDDVVSLV